MSTTDAIPIGKCQCGGTIYQGISHSCPTAFNHIYSTQDKYIWKKDEEEITKEDRINIYKKLGFI
jgi:hypothetical protein